MMNYFQMLKKYLLNNKFIIDQLSTQYNSTQLNWVKRDNDYWSVPPKPHRQNLKKY